MRKRRTRKREKGDWCRPAGDSSNPSPFDEKRREKRIIMPQLLHCYCNGKEPSKKKASLSETIISKACMLRCLKKLDTIPPYTGGCITVVL